MKGHTEECHASQELCRVKGHAKLRAVSSQGSFQVGSHDKSWMVPSHGSCKLWVTPSQVSRVMQIEYKY